MEKKNYRSYPEAFKLEALALLEKHEKSAGQIERELGITPGLLVKWRARYQAVSEGSGAMQLEPNDIETAHGAAGGGSAEGARHSRKISENLLPEEHMKY